MTLRKALLQVDLPRVYQIIFDTEQRYMCESDRPMIEQTVGSYSRVITELLRLPVTKPYTMPWLVQETIDPFDGLPYPDVCFLNTRYVAPKPGLKPWGARKGEKVPKGYYNVNLNKHNRTFGAGLTPWSKIIDTPIRNTGGYPLERVVAEILKELTFYGWTEQQVESTYENIKADIEVAKKEIDEGNCVKLPSSKKGGLTVVIPDSVSQKIMDIVNGKKKKK